MKKPGKTLVIGSESFLGKAFFKAYSQIDPDTLGTHYRSADASRRLDLLNPDLSPLRLKKGEYSHALIAAANANLAACEQEKGIAFRRNVEGILKLVELLIEQGIQPILFSTAYVFDGVFGDYVDDSPTCPINEYGKQKETVEKKIKDLCGENYLTIRCSKVFDLVKGGGTLIDQIGSTLMRGESIRAAYDQVFCPILLEDLVQGVLALQADGRKGLYNLCGVEAWSRLELAEKIGKALDAPSRLVVPISLDEVQSPFRIPKKTDMRCEKFYSCVDFRMTSLSDCIKRLKVLYKRENDNILRETVVG